MALWCIMIKALAVIAIVIASVGTARVIHMLVTL